MPWASVAGGMRLLLTLGLLAILSGCIRLDPHAGAPSEPDGVATSTSSASSSSSTATPTCGTSSSKVCCPEGWRQVSYGCGEPLAVHLLVTTDGAGRIGVPFPHLDRCLSAEDWGGAWDRQAPTTLVTSDRGDVVQLVAAASSSSERVLNLTKPTCQTFRYDPWSIEPDPKDGTLEVQADRAIGITVTVRTSDGGGCWTATLYSGATAAGWTTLTSKDGPRTSCV